ncbi:MAG: hypothetical protein ACOVOR_04520 [Rhabdochlamydiaceae bacterium]
MDNNHKKEGFSVKEIENFTKAHSFEVLIALSFVLAALFSFMFFGVPFAMWVSALGGVLGVVFSKKIPEQLTNIIKFVIKQETVIQMVLAGVVLILSIFLPPLIFFSLGLLGGERLHQLYTEASQK